MHRAFVVAPLLCGMMLATAPPASAWSPCSPPIPGADPVPMYDSAHGVWRQVVPCMEDCDDWPPAWGPLPAGCATGGAPSLERVQIPRWLDMDAPDGDADGDGVPDRWDACVGVPGIPAERGAPVDCADVDGDGWEDAFDACPLDPEPDCGIDRVRARDVVTPPVAASDETMGPPIRQDTQGMGVAPPAGTGAALPLWAMLAWAALAGGFLVVCVQRRQ